MRNPSPISVFDADVGQREDAEYCSVENGYILELEEYSPYRICVLRVWIPVMPKNLGRFNAHIVRDWNMRCERWYSSRSEMEDVFESICSGNYSVKEFVDNSCI